MGLKNLFKKKGKGNIETLEIMENYIREAKRLGYSERAIMRQFVNKGYPNELIMEAFELNLEQEVKMAKKKEDYEDEEDEEEEDSEEDEEELDEEEEEETKSRKKSTKKSKEEPKERPVTIQDVLANHEQRLAQLEAKLFRMLSA